MFNVWTLTPPSKKKPNAVLTTPCTRTYLGSRVDIIPDGPGEVVIGRLGSMEGYGWLRLGSMEGYGWLRLGLGLGLDGAERVKVRVRVRRG